MTDDLPTADLTRFLAKLPVFKQLKPSEREQLLTRCRLLALDHRKILQAGGEPHHHLWVVVTGEIAMVASSAEGDGATAGALGGAATDALASLEDVGVSACGGHRDPWPPRPSACRPRRLSAAA